MFFLDRGLEYNDFNFYVQMAFSIIPRKYEADEIIISCNEYFAEMYFISEGEICATVNYENIEVKRYFSEGFYIGILKII